MSHRSLKKFCAMNGMSMHSQCETVRSGATGDLSFNSALCCKSAAKHSLKMFCLPIQRNFQKTIFLEPNVLA